MTTDHSGHMTILKSLVDDLVSKEISILQIARDNTGVITLTSNDISWLSKLSRASLITNDQQENMLKFDFRYIQSYVIRTHLLLCHINYRHIIQKYQCYQRKNQTNNESEMIELGENYSRAIDREKLESEWSHLKDMLFDKLSDGYKLLRHIILLIKSNDNDLSHLSLNEFLNIYANDETIRTQQDRYEIRDFELCYLNHIQKLYSNAISDFHYLFTDVSQLLRTPIDDQTNEILNDLVKAKLIDVDYENDVEKLKSTIYTISKLLKELREIETTLFEQSTQSLGETCDFVAIENPILLWIPAEIRCENYVSLSIHFIRCRSILQEKLVNIEEKQDILWTEEIDDKQNPIELKNPFHYHLNTKEDKSQDEFINDLMGSEDGFKVPATTMNNWNDLSHLLDQDDRIPPKANSDHQQIKTDPINIDEQINCPPLYTMQLKSVLLESSPWFNLFNELKTVNGEEEKKGKSVTIVYPDETSKSVLMRKEKLYEQFGKIFKDKAYSIETYIPVDEYHIGLDLNDKNPSLPRDFPSKYSILEKKCLLQVRIEYGQQSIDYFTKSECLVMNIFRRSLNDPKLGVILNPEKVICLFDENERLIYEGIIGELFSVNDEEKSKLRLILIEENSSVSFNEISYRTSPADEEKRVLFHPNTIWQKLDDWFCDQSMAKSLATECFSYFLKEKNSIIDPTERILSTLESMTIDVVSKDSTIKVKISYENQFEEICVLKTTKINQLLSNGNLLQKLNLTASFLRDCVLTRGKNQDEKLSKEDTCKSIGEFSTDDQQLVEFRIAFLIQICTSNNDEKSKEVFLSDRKVTIEELFRIGKGIERGYKYLASYDTKKIIDFSQLLSDVNETRFLLVKKDQLCSIHIRRSTENQLISIDNDQSNMKQDFSSFATIADVYKANQLENQNEYLLVGKDFLPSMETPLSVFISTSPIEFDASSEKLAIHVIVKNSIDKQTINYHSSPQTQFSRLCSIACQLMHLNVKFYQLKYNEMELSDDEMCLDDLVYALNEVKFELICISSLTVSIKFEHMEILIPCIEETSVSEVVEEALLKLNFSKSDLSEFQLFALDDQETQVEMDYKIEETRDIFPENTETMKFELRKNIVKSES